MDTRYHMTTAIASVSANPVIERRLSIITVCRNEVGSIRKTADSVVKQTCDEFEWIVIDGGSTDGTLEILREYQDRIVHLVSEPDGGVYDAMNKGARLACGKWLLFLNGGDALAGLEVVGSILPFLTGGGEDILVGEYLCVWPDGRPARHKSHGTQLDSHHFYRRSVNHQSAIIGSQVFKRFGPYDVSFTLLGDHDFFVRAVLGGTRFQIIRQLIAAYDMSGMSAELKKSSIMKLERKRVRRRYSLVYRVRRLFNDLYVAYRNGLR